jgi:hypothetical protein
VILQFFYFLITLWSVKTDLNLPLTIICKDRLKFTTNYKRNYFPIFFAFFKVTEEQRRIKIRNIMTRIGGSSSVVPIPIKTLRIRHTAFWGENHVFLVKIGEVLRRPEMMCTQGRLDYDWFYSLKTLAHFRSKVLVDFLHYVTQINCLTGAIIARHILRRLYLNKQLRYTILHSTVIHGFFIWLKLFENSFKTIWIWKRWVRLPIWYFWIISFWRIDIKKLQWIHLCLGHPV